MRNDKHIALQLRRKGKSYKQIQKETHIPISTLSDWFSGIEWSAALRSTLVKKAGKAVSRYQRIRWETWRQKYRAEAVKEFPSLSRNPLFIAGLMLYWGEGDNSKGNSRVRLVNTDPRMIDLFCSFLRQIIRAREDKIRASLVLYPDLSDTSCKRFWSQVTKIPTVRFHKTQFIQGRHPTKRTSYGMCTVLVTHPGLKEKIITWVDLLYNEYKA